MKNIVSGAGLANMLQTNRILISVIIPVYNAEPFLTRCLDSVTRQTFRDIEVICVDDGSTDKSGEILDLYAKSDSRIVVVHKENGGAGSARNAAFPLVRGKYIFFSDADDWLEQKTLERCLSCMDDDIDVVVAGIKVENEGAASPEEMIRLQSYCTVQNEGKFRITDPLIDKITVYPSGKLMRNEILKSKGLVFSEEYRFEDNAFTTEYLIHCKNCYLIADNLYHYAQHSNSESYGKTGDYCKSFLHQFDYLYKRLEKQGLSGFHRTILTRRYISWLRLACKGRSFNNDREVKELATRLARSYDTELFTNDWVMRVKNREYGLVPAFDKDVVLIMKPGSTDKAEILETIKSLLEQSYKLPKIVLYMDDSIVSEDFWPEVMRQHINKNLFVEPANVFSLPDKQKEFPDHVLVTAESGVTYPKNWLRCVMAAYPEQKDAFAVYCFNDIQRIDETMLFKDFSIIEPGPDGRGGCTTVLKSRQIIVSVTSYPARINAAMLAVKSVFRQTRRPDKVILWLGEDEFPNKNKDLPEELVRLTTDENLEIQWREDLGPHTKYFYAFKEYPDALIITIDDDILYPPDRIENLYLCYLLFPHAVSAARADLVTISERGEMLPVTEWPSEGVDVWIYQPSMQLYAMGVCAVLYPVKLFSGVLELLDKEVIRRTCPYADDLWLKAMQAVAGIPVVVSEEEQALPLSTRESQETALWRINVINGENNKQWLMIQEEFDSRYGMGTLIRKLMDTSAGKDLIGSKGLCELIRKYRLKTEKLRNQYAKYTTLRIDIKNKGGSGCSVAERILIPRAFYVEKPAWLPNGMTISATGKQMDITVRCEGDGELEIHLLGRDARNTEGIRYPVWIDVACFIVNGETVFKDTRTVCHDKRYVYRRKVNDGETLRIYTEWSECRSSNVLDEYRQLQANLKTADNKVKRLEKDRAETVRQLDKERELTKKLKKELENIKRGWSFKIGRVITYLPRKLK